MADLVYLLLGSNMGDSKAFLGQAREAVSNRVGVIRQQSSLYRTAPWGNTDQQDFYNQVLEVETARSARECLIAVLKAELDMGRVRHEKWAPRTIDIDILFFSNAIINESDLKVPHPLLHKRRFTLEPLNEIAPDLVHPLLKMNISSLLAACDDLSVVEKL
jgi:2-amino-4-hydroxy-6-hydroxymethyldihydropteridine diphosphokinase